MITTQVTDTSLGRPVERVPVELDVFITGKGWHEVGRGVTNSEGMIADFGEPAAPGLYRLMFDAGSYLPEAFFPSINVIFDVSDSSERCHLPLLLSRFGYSVYRG